ncbi:MAG: hypothetical protein ACREEC_09940, partial [Thermoplasmata archaeon]
SALGLVQGGSRGEAPRKWARQRPDDVPGEAVAVRYWHVRSPDRFTARMGEGELPVEDVEVVSAAAHEAERVMVGLRLAAGVTLVEEAARREAEGLAGRGLLDWDGRTARATRRGQEVLNALVERLVPAH